MWIQGHSRHGISQRQGWHPLGVGSSLGERDGAVLGTQCQYRRALLRAAALVATTAGAGGRIWVVNMSRELECLVEGLCAPHERYVSYSASGLLPGTLTNWRSLSRSVLSYGLFSRACDEMLSRERLSFPRYRRLQRLFRGLVQESGVPHSLPDLLILVNPGALPRVVAEATRMHIPVVGLVASDTSCVGVHYPIPLDEGHPQRVYEALSHLLGVLPRK